MSTNLSRHFQQQRLDRGMKPGQLARLAGCVNAQKNGNCIRQFELSGSIGQEPCRAGPQGVFPGVAGMGQRADPALPRDPADGSHL